MQLYLLYNQPYSRVDEGLRTRWRNVNMVDTGVNSEILYYVLYLTNSDFLRMPRGVLFFSVCSPYAFLC